MYRARLLPKQRNCCIPFYEVANSSNAGFVQNFLSMVLQKT
jgi:hypothetical protein